MTAESVAVFLLAAAYDILLGEPPAKVHPVVWIGKLIAFLRAHARPSRTNGIALAIVVIVVTALAGHLTVKAAGYVPLLPLFVSAFLLKSTVAIRCLLQVSRDIGQMIDRDMDEAKSMLPALVGRAYDLAFQKSSQLGGDRVALRELCGLHTLTHILLSALCSFRPWLWRRL